MSLTNKVFLASGLVLISLGLASFGILYRAQTQLATQEMDTLLENQALSLSTLVSARPNGKFDFEMSTYFFSQFQLLKPHGFFRFVDPQGERVLRDSPGAPALACIPGHSNRDVTVPGQGEYRVKTAEFRPEVDSEVRGAPSFVPPLICLIVGIETSPYRALVWETLRSTLPPLIALVVCLVAVLLFLVRRLTGDLSRLTAALAVADFGLTHAFPILPEAQTLEVEAMVEKLAGLHAQATDVYRQMWLFLGRAAHQMKTPVAAMQATLQVLLRKERSKEELLSGLADVESAASLLAELTQKLISSSRISYQETPADEWIDLHSFFLEQLRLFRSKSEQQGVSMILVTASPLRCFSNSFLLAELFGNLIDNAIQYSPKNRGGQVSVSWASTGSGSVEVVIADQGPGFPDQVKRNLFEPFVRGDERLAPGSGLGLSIANRAAQLLGGSIALKPTHEKGSQVAVCLPIEGKKH